FVSVGDVFRFCQDVGFSPTQIDWALSRCLRARLAEGPARTVDRGEDDGGASESSYVRATTSGAYYVRRMTSNFTYVDAVVVDTPVTDPDVRHEIRDVATIGDRLSRAEAFRAY